MGKESERSGSHEGWAEDGYVPCPESAYPKWPSRSPADRIEPSKAAKIQELPYPDKVAPGAVTRKGGTV